MQTSSKPKFYDKHCTAIVCFWLSALSIAVFLSVAFVCFDATNLPASSSSSGGGLLPKVQQPSVNQPAPSQDLIAAVSSLLQSVHLESLRAASAGFFCMNLNATVSPDNTMWRYTSDGWRDISMMSNQAQNPQPLLESVHPAIWAAMLLLSSWLLLIMASNDSEIRGLFGRSNTGKRQNLDEQLNQE